ncbi:alpha/beta hydrolase [Cytophagaceae bacterium DM2B3-1]|uniref:Alpha/beta hydrolase n=1 Tax=Xanthocytophaga flava TaxID=3048013 RepID=A0ABT7CMB8_9BACT|nr:alpha/beta hydrolase [Xanthocytophaga flavus]MDJ1494848.1 alpha/beta hydrolase [Xanthocytophaga flavus]
MISLFLGWTSVVNAQQVLPLYPAKIPNTKSSKVTETGATSGIIRGITKPTLQVYLPEKDKATGTGVVIIPGGGYGVVVYQGEGIDIAKEFVKRGIAAFVLKYRLPNDSIMPDKKIGPLQDAQQAIKFVRENASKWGVDTHKIGIMGFSAGGHLASTEATHFEKSLIDNPEQISLRPDFQILVYPVISMSDSLTHQGSQTNLLGKDPSTESVKLFSNELQVTKNTPPAYITHTADDKVVDVDNSIAYFEALRREKVEVEMHIYPKGNHGFIFHHPGWMEPLFDWMKRNNWIKY